MAGMLLFCVSLVTPIIQQFATGLQEEQPQEFAFAENRFFHKKRRHEAVLFSHNIFMENQGNLHGLCTVLP